jgi:hypothetical protein
MKPGEHGEVHLESREEFQATLGAIQNVLDGVQDEADFDHEREVYEKLKLAVTAQLDRKDTDAEAGVEDASFSTTFDETTSEFVLTALRVAADGHTDRDVRQQAGGMIMDYTIAAAELEMQQPPGEGE